MTRPRGSGWSELPIDVVDATGLLGALAGVLSLVQPYFLALTATLSALLLTVGLLRRETGRPPVASLPAGRRWYWAAVAAASAAWLFLFVHPASADRFAGAALGAGGLPLWAIARRPIPFGGR